jgi:hypothetical protein
MAYTGGIEYLPVRDTNSARRMEVKFYYPEIGKRCALVGPLWKLPVATLLERCKEAKLSPNKAESNDTYWVRFDDGRDLNGNTVECLDFIPILNLPSKFTHGLLVQEKETSQIYNRIGVASVQTRSDYTVFNRVMVT